MKREITIVPKDKCPLDVLAELGERTSKAWIFLHANAVEKLRSTVDGFEEYYNSFTLRWDASDKSPKTSINISDTSGFEWYEVFNIDAENIAFKNSSVDPEEIFFLKMEK